MKKYLTVVALLITLTVQSQTSAEHVQNGIAKQKKDDYKGAFSDFDKANKVDNKNAEAYYYRGYSSLAINDYNVAIKDFSMAIELNPKYGDAYFSRATAIASQEKFMEALPDLDKAIELDPTIPHALTLRGQIRFFAGDKKGACDDFNHAKQIGDNDADRFLKQVCGIDQQARETFLLNWPEEENWKVAHSDENDVMILTEYIPAHETLENWTELGFMMILKETTDVQLDKAMETMHNEALQSSPQAKLTFLEKDLSAEYPWILFMIEAPHFKNDPKPESQLWYIVQGKEALYINFRAVKKASISDASKEHLIKFFKAGKIVNK